MSAAVDEIDIVSEEVAALRKQLAAAEATITKLAFALDHLPLLREWRDPERICPNYGGKKVGVIKCPHCMAAEKHRKQLEPAT